MGAGRVQCGQIELGTADRIATVPNHPLLTGSTAVDKLTGPILYFWLGAALLTQLAWGIYPVCTRFLQTHAAAAIPSLQLAVVIIVVSWPGIFIFCMIPSLLFSCWQRHRAAQAQVQEAAVAAAAADIESIVQQPTPVAVPLRQSAVFDNAVKELSSDCHASIITTHRPSEQLQSKQLLPTHAFPPSRAKQLLPPDALPPPQEQGTPFAKCVKTGDVGHCCHVIAAAEQPEEAAIGGRSSGQLMVCAITNTNRAASYARLKHWLRAMLVTALLGLLVVLYGSLGLLYASYFVQAYIVQLVMLLTPLLTAVANKLVLHQPSPYMLWQSLTMSLLGSGLVVAGQWMEDRNSNGGSSCSTRTGLPPQYCTLIGLGVTCVSAILCSMYFLTLQVSRNLVVPQHVLIACRGIGLAVLLPLAVAVEGSSWAWVLHLNALDWSVLVFTSIAIFTFGNLGLQHCSRKLGAATVANLNCSRLLSCVALSAVLLQEVPRHALTWVGLVVVVVSLTLFVYWQSSPQAVQQHGAGVLMTSLSRKLSPSRSLGTPGTPLQQSAASQSSSDAMPGVGQPATSINLKTSDDDLLWLSGLTGACPVPPMLAVDPVCLAAMRASKRKAISLVPRRSSVSQVRVRINRASTSPSAFLTSIVATQGEGQ